MPSARTDEIQPACADRHEEAQSVGMTGGGESAGAGTSLTLAAPSGTGTPLVAILSLMVTGTPSSAPLTDHVLAAVLV